MEKESLKIHVHYLGVQMYEMKNAGNKLKRKNIAGTSKKISIYQSKG
jgi:hypothetical protein